MSTVDYQVNDDGHHMGGIVVDQNNAEGMMILKQHQLNMNKQQKVGQPENMERLYQQYGGVPAQAAAVLLQDYNGLLPGSVPAQY